MKFFAITPDNCTCNAVVKHLNFLKNKGVSFIYLRSALLIDGFEKLIPAVNASGILPIIPAGLAENFNGLPFGIHFRNSETELLSDQRFESYTFKTASCHDFAYAAKLLQSPLQYVYVSPVFKPLSKPDDTRELFPRRRLKKLITAFGEKVVVLGGLNSERITQLKKSLKHDFSVAGTTMFFGK